MRQVELVMESANLDSVRLAQSAWAATPLRVRLGVISELRKRMASGTRELAETVPLEMPGALHRSRADSLASEVLTVIEACRFLERESGRILRTKRLGWRGRPIWLGNVETELERAPWGVVLLLGAANYPLFLAGVQCLQSLAAGNAVLWKPALGTAAAALAFRLLLVESGLQPELLTVLDTSVAAAEEAIAGGVDFVVLTGSAETGKAVLRQLAETLTPATMELSGCDAVFVLPGSDLDRTVKALKFGLRFNGSNTCMAPRRVFLVGLDEAHAGAFEARLTAALRELTPVALPARTLALLGELVGDARAQDAEVALGAEVALEGAATLILKAAPAMRAMRTDIFAPLLSVMRAVNVDEALAANAACPYALSASIFGPEEQARSLASRLKVGNVLINDVITPSVDPRIAFGGRGRSGFGVTRGAEGLLAMTTPRTIQVQRSRSTWTYDPIDERHEELFAGLAELLHGAGLGVRWAGLKRLIRAGRLLR